MRSSIADYEVLEVLGLTPAGRCRYLCRPPGRLGLGDPVMVTELTVGAQRWPSVLDALAGFSAVRSDRLIRIIELGPDLGASSPGGYLATEVAVELAPAEPAEAAVPTSGTPGGAGLRLMRDVAMGVHALHEAGVAHGRIDPSHALSTSHGGVVWPPPVDDPLGLVGRCNDWRSIAAVDPAVLAGWPPDRRSDIWSIGAVLHGVLSRRPLYPGIEDEPPSAAVHRLLFTRPEVDPAIPEPLAQLIASCLEVDPGGRPTSAESVATDLSSAVEAV